MGIGYWPALIIAPIAVGIFGMILERTMLQWLSGLDHLYGLLLTFGIALIVQGVFQNYFGSSGLPYAIPDYPQLGDCSPNPAPGTTCWRVCRAA